MAAGSAAAAVPTVRTAYGGTTSQRTPASLELRPKADLAIRRFAVRYRSACDDGERLRSTFRFSPIELDGTRFSRSGRVAGMLTDGRAFTSRVRMTGRFTASGAIKGTFRLTTRIADGMGGVARCATGALTWRMRPAGD